MCEKKRLLPITKYRNVITITVVLHGKKMEKEKQKKKRRGRERESVRKERVAGQCGNDRFLCELSQPGLKRTQCVSQ